MALKKFTPELLEATQGHRGIVLGKYIDPEGIKETKSITVVEFVEHKNPDTREWQKSVVYICQGKRYSRTIEDFCNCMWYVCNHSIQPAGRGLR
ncbi:hypothetical protein GR7B_00232 [Vibrio phage vB_VcorM_GR7B]|nr:hypothetical protein GR7B_00232 [Vibrio phage vB_VcorM_GR7B]